MTLRPPLVNGAGGAFVHNPWFRMYHEFAGDPVIQSLAFEDQRHYVVVLCLKAGGTLDREYPSDDFRSRVVYRGLGLDPVAGAEAKRRLIEARLIDDAWQPCGWDKRQYRSDNSTERVRAYRGRKSSPTPPPEDKETEQNRTEQVVTGNVSETLPKRKTKASRIPEDFGITPDRKAYAEKHLPKVDAAALMDAFRDHWAAASGAKATKLDWDATWRTWVRNANQFGYPTLTVHSPQAKQVRYDANGREIV